MAANGSPTPELDTDEDRSYFVLRLPVHPKATAEPVADVGEETTSKTSGRTPVKTPDLILQVLRAHPEMTLAEVAQAIGKSLRAVERAAARLVKAGRLRFVGPKKGGHWELDN
jgi:ATP-dependent DNA helicase RecG